MSNGGIEMNVEKIVKGRIKDNERLFNKNDYSIIEENINLIEKIYLLGYLDAREIYMI